MRSHPEDKSGVFAMPAAALVMTEETPGISIVLIHHEDADPAASCPVTDVGTRRHVFLPDDGEEKWTSAVHDSDIRETPILVVVSKGIGDGKKEGMLWDGPHSVVGDTCWGSPPDPGWV